MKIVFLILLLIPNLLCVGQSNITGYSLGDNALRKDIERNIVSQNQIISESKLIMILIKIKNKKVEVKSFSNDTCDATRTILQAINNIKNNWDKIIQNKIIVIPFFFINTNDDIIKVDDWTSSITKSYFPGKTVFIEPIYIIGGGQIKYK